MIKPVDLLRVYLAVKLHFSVLSYDAVENNARVKGATLEALEKRHDRKLIYNAAKKFNTIQEATTWLVANASRGNLYPFSEMERSDDIFTAWLRVKQSITRTFKDETSRLTNICTDLNIKYEDLILKDTKNPMLLNYIGKRDGVSPETVIMLDHFDDFLEGWYSAEQTIWKPECVRLIKYKRFVKFDKDIALKLYCDMNEEIQHHENV